MCCLSPIAVFAAAALNATPETLATRIRAIADLKKSALVLAIGRFSNPPALEDLAGLSLDEADLDDIRRCRPGACDLKLSASEIEALKRVSAEAGPDWKDALQRAFRRLVLERVNVYQSRGAEALSSYHDHADPVHPQDTFAAIVRDSPYLRLHVPQFAAYLERYPREELRGVESFLYWSKEQFGGKPTVSVTHVNILRTDPDPVVPAVLVAGRQIFATHYMNGALSLTTVLPGRAGSSGHLLHLNRSEVDALGGLFGPLKRAIIEGRIKRETAEIFRGLRSRLESGS
jgi:hypothetical protein